MVRGGTAAVMIRVAEVVNVGVEMLEGNVVVR